MDVMTRLEVMGICPSALLDVRVHRGAETAARLVLMESMADSYGVMPASGGLGDQLSGMVEAFAVAREAKSVRQRRELREMRELRSMMETKNRA